MDLRHKTKCFCGVRHPEKPPMLIKDCVSMLLACTAFCHLAIAASDDSETAERKDSFMQPPTVLALPKKPTAKVMPLSLTR